MGVIALHSFPVFKIHGFVPLGVLKSKMTSVRDMVVHTFYGIEPKNMRGSKCQSTDWVPLRSKKLFRAHPQNRILVTFRGSFKISNDHPVTFIWESVCQLSTVSLPNLLICL